MFSCRSMHAIIPNLDPCLAEKQSLPNLRPISFTVSMTLTLSSSSIPIGQDCENNYSLNQLQVSAHVRSEVPGILWLEGIVAVWYTNTLQRLIQSTTHCGSQSLRMRRKSMKPLRSRNTLCLSYQMAIPGRSTRHILVPQEISAEIYSKISRGYSNRCI